MKQNKCLPWGTEFILEYIRIATSSIWDISAILLTRTRGKDIRTWRYGHPEYKDTVRMNGFMNFVHHSEF
jgi:hypothetical protein